MAFLKFNLKYLIFLFSSSTKSSTKDRTEKVISEAYILNLIFRIKFFIKMLDNSTKIRYFSISQQDYFKKKLENRIKSVQKLF